MAAAPAPGPPTRGHGPLGLADLRALLAATPRAGDAAAKADAERPDPPPPPPSPPPAPGGEAGEAKPVVAEAEPRAAPARPQPLPTPTPATLRALDDLLRSTPEHRSFLAAGLSGRRGADAWRAVPALRRAAAVAEEPAAGLEAPAVTARYLRAQGGEGRPVVVRGGAAGWAAGAKWTFAWLRREHGAAPVLANDRAPARARDAADGLPQTTVRTTLGEYLAWLEAYGRAGIRAAPLYLNGWKGFSEVPDLARDVEPALGFVEDDTCAAMVEVDRRLGLSRALGQAPEAYVAESNFGLNKVFIGPAGTTTRLHFDAHGAHGWLAVVRGRKLFVLVPPSHGAHLYPFDRAQSEVGPAHAPAKETTQSPVDPLAPDLRRYPEYAKAELLAAVCGPGDVIVIPKGWWHYAVALEPCITVMRNWWNHATNVQDLLRMIIDPMKKILERRRRQGQQRGPGGDGRRG